MHRILWPAALLAALAMAGCNTVADAGSAGGERGTAAGEHVVGGDCTELQEGEMHPIEPGCGYLVCRGNGNIVTPPGETEVTMEQKRWVFGYGDDHCETPGTVCHVTDTGSAICVPQQCSSGVRCQGVDTGATFVNDVQIVPNTECLVYDCVMGCTVGSARPSSNICKGKHGADSETDRWECTAAGTCHNTANGTFAGTPCTSAGQSFAVDQNVRCGIHGDASCGIKTCQADGSWTDCAPSASAFCPSGFWCAVSEGYKCLGSTPPPNTPVSTSSGDSDACKDGQQNNGEWGVDCGGPCPQACGSPPPAPHDGGETPPPASSCPEETWRCYFKESRDCEVPQVCRGGEWLDFTYCGCAGTPAA